MGCLKINKQTTESQLKIAHKASREDKCEQGWYSVDPLAYDGSHLNADSNTGGVYDSRNLNVYAYVHNRPLILIDPDGKDPTPKAFKAAASKLGVDVASIKAVYKVETNGSAFRSNGDPKVLFERHYFSRNTNGKYDATHSDISNPSAGGYGKYSEQIGKLRKAVALDKEAGYKSASYGGFQIMGENHKRAGYDDVESFAKDMMSKDEDKHLGAFSNFVNGDKKMKEALQEKDWAGFAKRYNGPGYKSNKYDTKLEKAYESFSQEKSEVQKCE